MCPLAVPKYVSLRKGADQAHFLRAMAYRDKADAANGKGSPVWESTDEYVGRMQGYIAFYAALVQAEQPGHPLSLEYAWAFCARCALLGYGQIKLTVMRISVKG